MVAGLERGPGFFYGQMPLSGMPEKIFATNPSDESRLTLFKGFCGKKIEVIVVSP
jgi:hypothetical protein